MLQILLLHGLAALGAPALVARWGRRMFAVLALAPLSAAIYALTLTSRITSGEVVTQRVRWVPQLDLEIVFRIDTLSWFMLLIVGGVGALVLAYTAWYFSSAASGLPRFAGVFVAFAGAMLGLVSTDSTLMLYLFWELTTVFSYLLIGHYSDRKVSRRAAMQAIIVTTVGGLTMLGGFVLLGEAPGGSYLFSELVSDPPTTAPLTSVAIACVLVGAVSKSALVPFQFWLPAAMAAPTPVSAYLHAAAMVKAGVYLVARLAPGFATWDAWAWPLLVLACLTMLVGGYRAMRQWDLKLVLAYGTVSQLGLLMMLVGQADRAVALAGLAMLGAHAMFKATLFLVVGIVDAATGTRDLHQLSGLRHTMPFGATIAALAIASMIGFPPMAGYVAKEAAIEGLLHAGEPEHLALLAVLVAGSVLTVGYSLRLWWGAFADKPGLERTQTDHEAWPMFASPTLLAAGGLAVGLTPAISERLLAPYAETYPAGATGHLVLWSGFGIPLLLTVAVLTLGTALFWWFGRESRLQSARSFPLEIEGLYRHNMRRLDRVAAHTTAVAQRGSVPYYLAIILVTALGGVTAAVLARQGDGGALGPVRLWDGVAQAWVGAFIVIAAIATIRSRRRLKAVIWLGVGGYGVALLYGLQGAPDLALTQVLVETVTLVVFVLVLRRMPPYFSDRPLARSRWSRAVLAIAVGGGVSLLAVLATGARVAVPVSVYFPEETYAYGHGTNIVNVTLVDTRAWDTMGEISVLLVAATGVASLIFLRVQTSRVERAADLADGGALGGTWTTGITADPAMIRLGVAGAPDTRSGPDAQPVAAAPGQRDQLWISAAASLARWRRSVILEIATRLLFHVMILYSLYLLFAGHNAPGGGFAGGLVAGIALILRYLAGGRYELGEAAPVNAGLLLGTGLFLSVGAGLVPLPFGGTVLQSVVLEVPVGALGNITLVTSLFFDIGVYLLVIGVVLDVLRTFGSELDRQGEQEGTAPAELAYDAADDGGASPGPSATGDHGEPGAAPSSATPSPRTGGASA